MNHHWLEKEKVRVNKERYREPGQHRESPSDYIIRKMELISLVYSYTDTEMVQATYHARSSQLLGFCHKPSIPKDHLRVPECGKIP
jgi:hypothetical protein